MTARSRPNIKLKLTDTSFVIPPTDTLLNTSTAACWAPELGLLATATEIQNGFIRVESQGNWFGRVTSLIQNAIGVTEGNLDRFELIMNGVSGSNGVTTGGAIGLLNSPYGTTYTVNILQGVTQGLTLTFGATDKFRPYWWSVQNVLLYGVPVIVGFSGKGFTGALGENPNPSSLTSPLTVATDFASTDLGYDVIFQPYHSDSGWSGADGFIHSDGADVVSIVGLLETSEAPVIGIVNAGLTGNLASDTDISVPTGADEYIIATAGFKKHLNSTANTTTASLISTPLAADFAGIICRNDATENRWVSPAGVQRGQVLNSVSLSKKLTTAQQDKLYSNNVNPFISVKGSGTFLFGDITNAVDTSSLISVNVIRTIIYIKTRLLPLASAILFNNNTTETRSLFTLQAEGLLQDIQSQGGLTEFIVICDESNNTQDVIDAKSFIASVKVKVPGSVNYIVINLNNN